MGLSSSYVSATLFKFASRVIGNVESFQENKAKLIADINKISHTPMRELEMYEKSSLTLKISATICHALWAVAIKKITRVFSNTRVDKVWKLFRSHIH